MSKKLVVDRPTFTRKNAVRIKKQEAQLLADGPRDALSRNLVTAQYVRKSHLKRHLLGA